VFPREPFIGKRTMRQLIWTTILAAVAVTTSSAAEVYVDNVNGSDGYDGLAPDVRSAYTGPVRSLRRATQILQRADALVIHNTGRAYFEPLLLTGGRHSGLPGFPLVIRGNGAMLCGLRQLPADGWESLGAGLWRLTLTRKGSYRFFQGEQPWPEFRPEAGWGLADLPEGEWASRQGQVYFRFPQNEPPNNRAWTYAADEQGLSLVDVRQVQILDLKVLGFRVDGVNVDNACRDVSLERIDVQHNGRAGLAVGGSARVKLAGSRLRDNGRYSVLVTELAGVEIEGSDLGGVEPTVVRSTPVGGGSVKLVSASASAAASTSVSFSPVGRK
jgi:hypothetical protein